jgi:hypothetical protein
MNYHDAGLAFQARHLVHDPFHRKPAILLPEIMHELGILKKDDTVGERSSARVMGYHHDGCPQFAAGTLQQFEDTPSRFGIQISGWLISQDDFRVIDEGPDDRNPLLLASRELIRTMHRAIVQADQTKQFIQTLATLS